MFYEEQGHVALCIVCTTVGVFTSFQGNNLGVKTSFSHWKPYTVDPLTTEFESTYMEIFLDSKYYSTTQSALSGTHRCETAFIEESWMQGVCSKLYTGLHCMEGWPPLPPVLFKGQLYFHIIICFFPRNVVWSFNILSYLCV